MPNVAMGQPYQVGLTFYEDDGSYQTTGVTATVATTGPDGAAVTGGSGSLAHQGDGFWAFTIPGTGLTAPGAYTATITVTAPSGVAAQVVTFTAGVVLPWMRPLREVLTALYHRLDDAIESSANGGATGSLIDNKLNGRYADNELAGSELILLERGDLNFSEHHLVQTTVGANGTFNFTPTISPAVASGDDYLLVNLRGKGVPYRRARQAITQAVLAMQLRLPVSDEVTLMGSSTDYRYTIPASWTSVIKAPRYRFSGDVTGEWWDIAPAYCEVQPDRRRLIVRRPLSGATLRIEGTYPANPPTTLTSLVEAPLPAVVDRALLQLRIDRGDLPQAQALAATSGAGRGLLGQAPRANEVWLG